MRATLFVLCLLGCNTDKKTDTVDPDTDTTPAACGDGVLDPGELCDPGITGGEGACPASCATQEACVSAELVGEDCAQQCIEETIADAADGDGCCLDGSDAVADDDCEPVCGNGVLEPGELCEPESTNDEEVCPESCGPKPKACESIALVGEGCEVECVAETITEAADGDGCCPEGVSHDDDSDCFPVSVSQDAFVVCELEGSTLWSPTLAASDEGFLVGCLERGSQKAYPEVIATDPSGKVLWQKTLYEGNAYYYAEVSLTAYDGEYQALVLWNASSGTWTPGWGTFRQHLWSLDRETGSGAAIPFGRNNHSSVGQTGWSGSQFAVAYVSYDYAYIAAPPTAQATGSLIAQDPDARDDRFGARGAIAWDGDHWGLFYNMDKRLFFAEATLGGTAKSGLTEVDETSLQAFYGGITAAHLDGTFYAAHPDGIIGIDSGGAERCSLALALQDSPSLLSVGDQLWTLDSDGELVVLDADCDIIDGGPIEGATVGELPRITIAPDGSRAGLVSVVDGAVTVQPLDLGP